MITGGRISTHIDFYMKRVEEIVAQDYEYEIQFVEGTGDVYINFGSEVGKWN
jgi:hypothetical protein